MSPRSSRPPGYSPVTCLEARVEALETKLAGLLAYLAEYAREASATRD